MSSAFSAKHRHPLLSPEAAKPGVTLTSTETKLVGVVSETPKALADFSPVLERSDNSGLPGRGLTNPEGVSPRPNPFRVDCFLRQLPGVLASLEPRAEISERLRRLN